MKPPGLIVRCYAETVDAQWQAFCLDLCLAVQGESFQEVKDKLERMICDYVTDAVVGEDKEYAYQLLNRRAPLKYWAKYYYAVVLHKFGALRKNVRLLFREPLPLHPGGLNNDSGPDSNRGDPNNPQSYITYHVIFHVGRSELN